MEAAFLWVIVIAVALGVVIAVVLLFMGGSSYDSIGSGAFGLDGHEQKRGQKRALRTRKDSRRA